MIARAITFQLCPLNVGNKNHLPESKAINHAIISGGYYKFSSAIDSIRDGYVTIIKKRDTSCGRPTFPLLLSDIILTIYRLVLFYRFEIVVAVINNRLKDRESNSVYRTESCKRFWFA